MTTRRNVLKFGGAAFAAALGGGTLAGCSGSGGGGGSATTLRMSTQLSDSAPMVQGFKAWADAVKERTGGEIEIELFTSGQLGSDEDVIEQALSGVNVAVLTDGGRMSNYVEDIGIIGMPYIADNYDEVRAITETDTFASFDEGFAAKGIKILAYNWYDGPRNFYTNSEVQAPADLNGLRIRTPGAPVWSTSVASLGATPVDMPWPDAYNAVQSGAIDGVEVQSSSAFPDSIYEVTSIMTRTEHFQLANFIMVGQDWLSTLSEEHQQILAEEAVAAATDNAQLLLTTAADYESQMQDAGLTINEPDRQPFKDAAESAYQELGFTELRDQIWAEIGK